MSVESNLKMMTVAAEPHGILMIMHNTLPEGKVDMKFLEQTTRVVE
jgi:hypothetical protein